MNTWLDNGLVIMVTGKVSQHDNGLVTIVTAKVNPNFDVLTGLHVASDVVMLLNISAPKPSRN